MMGNVVPRTGCLMDNLLKLLGLLLKANPDRTFGQVVLKVFPNINMLMTCSNDQAERRITDALQLRAGLCLINRVVLPVGIPGSGKSTLAQKMAGLADATGQTHVICSTDDFFVEGGVYKFNPGKLMEYHARNFQKFALALANRTDLVIVDNTNLRAEHREPYILLAKALGYEVEMPVVGEFTEEACKEYAGRNVHGVPLEGLRRMAASVQLP